MKIKITTKELKGYLLISLLSAATIAAALKENAELSIKLLIIAIFITILLKDYK